MGRIPRSGEVIDDRFTIEHLAGSGGMGQVYRARDRVSGGLVALKVMHDAERLELERFAREAHVLATLSHPGVVRYIHSGATGEGEPYLVMEWLSGETLSTRLQRTSISLAETLAVGRRVASALAAIHRRGVVHRDIKPSNLFLRGGAIEDVALIDFGMARRPVGDPKLTATGTMLGTPGYVAPEQVYNVPTLDGRADVFSLGCVLYRCLSGRAPFRGLHMLLNGSPDQLPRLRELRPAIPQELDDLVARMLSRSPDERPKTADAVAQELRAIEESDPNEPSALSARGGPRSVVSEIMGAERRLMSLVVVRPPQRAGARALAPEREGPDRALRAAVERQRGKLGSLRDGSLVASFSNAEAATDLAARAARCALALRRLLADRSIVVVTGREVLGPSMPETGLLDRALDLSESTQATAIRLDELTSSLIRNRFDTGATGMHLRGELPEADRVRLLLGEPGSCRGRDQELAQLETIFEHCVEERVASMVLLTGAAGAGKSCLGHELLRRLAARGEPVAIWHAEADPRGGGVAYGLLGQLLRRAFGLAEGGEAGATSGTVLIAESIADRRAKIRAWIERRGGGSARLVELLGELVGAPIESAPAGGRPEATPVTEQLRHAFLSLLRAECAAQPVVLVLEDLQWGDAPTLKLIDAALGALSDQPLMVLALARTKVHEIFPQLWAERAVQEIRLRGLSRRACEQIVRQALGAAADDPTVKDLVERSEGHASYLDELIRAAADGRAAATPPAMLAMVQARLEKLDPAARRVLRAASVFGETFWCGGIEALLGAGETAGWLAELVEQDVIATRDGGRFPADVEYRFRRAVVREVAYAMLTEGDRVAGHWLAGHWLEQAGETDPKILGDHFERCGRGGEAESPPQPK